MTQAPPPFSQPQWHYTVGQQQLGPVPAQAILAMLQTGALNPTSLVWREGMEQWTPIAAIPEFSYALAGATAPREEGALGLTTTGLIVFIILLVACVPLCWLPWVIDGLKAKRP